MARILVPGVLVGMVISLIANIIIGGIFYNLFDGSNVGTLVGTLAASLIGAILGAVAIFTSTRRDTAVILRGTAAGAFIGVVGGFLGSIDTARLEGIGSNVVLISMAVGAAVGAAGLRGTVARFFGSLVDGDEDSGILGKILDGALAGVIVGVACAIPITLFKGGSIYIFIRSVRRPERVEFVNVLSLDELLVGALLGIIIGTVIGLVSSRNRMDGMLNFILVGALLGIIWALPEVVVNTTTRLEGFGGGLVTFGEIAVVTLVSAVVGAVTHGFRLITWRHLALLGGGTGLAFVLPYILVTAALLLDDDTVTVGSASGNLPTGFWDTFLAWNRGMPIRLIANAVAGASVCLIVGAIMRKNVGTAFNGLVVTAILIAATLGLKGNYFLFLTALYLLGPVIDLPSFFYGFGEDLIDVPWLTLINVSFGTLIGLIIAGAMKLASRRSNPDRILPG